MQSTLMHIFGGEAAQRSTRSKCPRVPEFQISSPSIQRHHALARKLASRDFELRSSLRLFGGGGAVGEHRGLPYPATCLQNFGTGREQKLGDLLSFARPYVRSSRSPTCDHPSPFSLDLTVARGRFEGICELGGRLRDQATRRPHLLSRALWHSTERASVLRFGNPAPVFTRK